MKRGFLNRPNAFSKVSTECSSNTTKSQTSPEGSKVTGGLRRGTVDVGGFKAQEYQGVEEIDSTKLDYADEAWIASTQPARSMGTDIPDGWSECFITGRAKRAIVSVPGFPEALPRPDPSRPKPYMITESPGKGVGMIATRDIAWGELIIAERPMLIIPSVIRHMEAFSFPKDFTTDQLWQAYLNQMEKLTELLVNRMSKEDQDAYKKLVNCHQEDGTGPLFGIARTNGFVLGDYYEPKKAGCPDTANTYRGIFKDLSRVNHSCRPNTYRDWDSPTFSLQLRASKPIKKGEEITITYVIVTDPTSERQRQLAPWGFACGCEACSNPEISDAKLKEIKELLKAVEFLFNPITMNPATIKEMATRMGITNGPKEGQSFGEMVDHALSAAIKLRQYTMEPALKGLKLMEEEGLYVAEQYGELSEKVARGYRMMVGRSSEEKNREAKEWLEKYDEYREFFKSARNARWRKEMRLEEGLKKNQGEWEELTEKMNEMMKKMNPKA